MMKRRIYPCFVAGKQKPYANAVVVGNTIYISGMNGRSSETGEVASDTIESQSWRAFEQIESAIRQKPEAH
jgi:enamine deaminase RidA (YjgF/YER057c/UK114 family)